MINGAATGALKVPLRPALSREQLDAALHIEHGKWSELKKDRPRITCYTIDNVPKETPSDRDDGIYVEEVKNPTHGEKYRVYVTIADVAAHIPLKVKGASNPLADAAWQRAFTIYRPWGNDPMFPISLEHLMSLEHKKDRLGLTVAIDLDEQYQIKKTEFIRSKVRAKATDYMGARDRIEGVGGLPQKQIDRFRLMNEVGKGIRKHYFGNSSLESEVAREEMVYPIDRTDPETYAFKAQKMVETYMLLANHAVADFFHKTKLPFLYRNFDEAHAPKDGSPNRAYYSTDLTEHTELQKMGLKGAYCHFTSPIRRAPDFYNGHMVHYVIDVMNALEAILVEHVTIDNQPVLHAALWKRADVVMNHRTNASKLQKDVAEILREAISKPELAQSQTLALTIRQFTQEQGKIMPPLTTSQLETYAASINHLNHHEAELLSAPDMKEQWKDKAKIDRAKELVERAVEGEDAQERLGKKDAKQFSDLLRYSAVCGLLPEPLKQEAVKRLRKVIDGGGKNPDYFVNDALSVMIIAQHPESSDWIDLKKLMSKAIKNDPGTVSNVLTTAQLKGILPSIEEWNMDDDLRTASHLVRPGDHSGDRIHTAILMMPLKDGRSYVAAPYFSLGNNAKSAESHAKYSFLEHFAFGQLQTIGQQAIPNEVYAQLGSGTVANESFIRRMAQSIGANITIVPSKADDGREHVRITLAGGDRLIEPIERGGRAATVELAIEKTIKRLMRVPAFKDATAFALANDLHDSLNPRAQLENKARQQDAKIEVTSKQIQQHNPSVFEVKIQVIQGEATHLYTARDSNIRRATDAACIKVLEGMGWLDQSTPLARSWASDARWRDDEQPLAR